MNEKVIDEIAAQLGMAVDQAGDFIAQHLPDYAALKVVQLSTPIVAELCIAALLAVIAAAAIKATREIDKDETTICGVYLSSITMCAFVCAAAASAAYLGVALFQLCCDLPQIIGWQSYPEAMLIDTALEAVA